ncbi:acyltransferase [Thermococci archaeon]|nr:MAG: acyltransferase [Thermococci archaeon]RLF97055.1 MAG: acyltransferase [Thermococci archaeon]
MTHETGKKIFQNTSEYVLGRRGVKLRVAFAQTHPQYGEVDENLERTLSILERSRADLIVFPEMCLTGYNFESRRKLLEISEEIPGKATEEWTEVCREENKYLVAGVSEREGRRLYNSAVLVGPNGLIGKYRKTHLFHREKELFLPGDTGFRVFDLGSVRVGLMICFDWIFPEAARTLALKGADLIAHPANLVLPYCQGAMITRSIENRIYTVTANRIGREGSLEFTGMSQITSPKGEILARASREREEVREVKIDPREARDKKITDNNDVLKDRRPEFYEV